MKRMVIILMVALMSLNVFAGEAIIPDAVKNAQNSVLKMTLGRGSESIEAPPGVLLAGGFVGFVVMPFSQSLMAADSIYASIGGELIPCLPLGIDNGVALLMLMPAMVPSDSGVNFPQLTSPNSEAFYLVTIDKVTRMPIPAEQDIDLKSIFGGLVVDNYGVFYGIAVNITTEKKIKNLNIIPFPVIVALIHDVYEAAKKIKEESEKEEIRMRDI